MLRTPSFFGPLNSGFVPFSSAAPSDVLAEDDAAGAEIGEREAAGVVDDEAIAQAEAAEVVARASALPSPQSIEVEPRAVWAPASSTHIRIVEGAVIAAICAYFGYGLLRALAGI